VKVDSDYAAPNGAWKSFCSVFYKYASPPGFELDVKKPSEAQWMELDVIPRPVPRGDLARHASDSWGILDQVWSLDEIGNLLD
jgi:hypothetical protein